MSNESAVFFPCRAREFIGSNQWLFLGVRGLCTGLTGNFPCHPWATLGNTLQSRGTEGNGGVIVGDARLYVVSPRAGVVPRVLPVSSEVIGVGETKEKTMLNPSKYGVYARG